MAIIVSNNPFGDGHLPYPDDLRQGKLGLYVDDLAALAGPPPADGAADARAKFPTTPLLEQWQAEEIVIELPGRS